MTVTPDLATAVGRLIARVSHWEPARWAKPVGAGDTSRADLVHLLAQRIADATAAAEGEPRRIVPRLPNDLALPDQLRVLTTDALAVPIAPSAAVGLAAAVHATGQRLQGGR